MMVSVFSARGQSVEITELAREYVEEARARRLVGRRAHDVDLRGAGNRGQLVAHPLGDPVQREPVHVAGDRDADDPAPLRRPADDRLLGLSIGKVVMASTLF